MYLVAVTAFGRRRSFSFFFAGNFRVPFLLIPVATQNGPRQKRDTRESQGWTCCPRAGCRPDGCGEDAEAAWLFGDAGERASRMPGGRGRRRTFLSRCAGSFRVHYLRIPPATPHGPRNKMDTRGGQRLEAAAPVSGAVSKDVARKWIWRGFATKFAYASQ